MPDREIELDRAEYRPVVAGPLAKPSHLWWGFIGCGIAAVGAALLGVWGGTWFTALLPLPFAGGAGICLAGLHPGFWFRYEDRT